MRTSLLALAAGVLVLGSALTVRAQDIVDDVKRQQKIIADKFDADMREGLADAAKLAKSGQTKEARGLLAGIEVRLQIDRSLSPERRQELMDLVKSRIRQYTQQAVSGPGGSFEERMTRVREQNRQTEEKNAELAEVRKKTSELWRQGKFKEVAEVNEKIARKYGASPSTIGARRLAGAADTLTELRGIRDERSARYVRLQTELARMMLPIEGEVEFPPAEKWRELTKRRTKTTLTEKEQVLLKALQTPITLSFKDQPIQAILEEFEKKYGISIEVDKRGLDQAQLNYDTPVSINARGQSLRSVLKKMLGDVGLTFTIRKEGLRVTTPELAASDMVVRAYYIGDLLQVAGFSGDPFANQIQGLQTIASLIDTIQGIDPQSWESGGGKGTITFNPTQMAIIVKQSAEMQFALQGWLK